MTASIESESSCSPLWGGTNALFDGLDDIKARQETTPLPVTLSIDFYF